MRRSVQEALGHNCKAVLRAYAKVAQAVIPTLDSYERKLAAEADILPMLQVRIA